jgi:hypothetical protein
LRCRLQNEPGFPARPSAPLAERASIEDCGMSRLRWVILGVIVAALAAVVAVAVMSGGSGPSAPRSIADGRPLAATASVAPQSHLFGERIHVRIDAVVDRRRLDPNRVVLEAGWAPYQPAVPPVRTQRDVGSFTRLHWAFELYCVVADCAPQAGSIRRTNFEAATIRYRGKTIRGAEPSPVVISWPSISAVSRLDPIDLERRAIIRRTGANQQLRATLEVPWRRDSANLVPATYRISPQTIFWTGIAGALLFVAASGVLLQPYLPRLSGRRAGPSPLERAVATVERTRTAGDLVAERKALELLAAELRRSGEAGLAGSASELAWSEPVPEPELTGALTLDVREAIAARRNGHG